MQHSDVIKNTTDYHRVVDIIAKHYDLCIYYGNKTGYFDTHASAEFFHKELNIPLAACRKIVKYLRQEGVFYKARTAQNVFKGKQPSLGWTGFSKPHADTINYYGVDKKAIQNLRPVWDALSKQDQLDRVISGKVST